MAQQQDNFLEAGAEIIWVLEQSPFFDAGTAERCATDIQSYGGTTGWCVGDGQTQPLPGTFDKSPFSVQRGFDMIVVRETMEIVYSTSHGTEAGNENLNGEAVLEEVRRWTAP